jgi:phosphohistidine phosphatase
METPGAAGRRWCVLVRHGAAGPAATDRLRPLTPEGRAGVEATARRLEGRGVAVAEIRHSGLVRARETAEILAARLRPAGGLREVTGLAPEDDPEIARAELELAAASLLLVGHLPHLGRLAARLVRGDDGTAVVELSPGAAVGLVREDRRWTVDFVLAPGIVGATDPPPPGGASR